MTKEEMGKEITLDQIFGKEHRVSTVNDPFQKDCIEGITLRCSKKWFSEGFDYDAYIQFENGNTSGEHHIEGTSLADIFFKAKEFCEGLE